MSKSEAPKGAKDKGAGKGGKGGKNGKWANSLEEWPEDSNNQAEEAGSLFLFAVDRYPRYSRSDWEAWNNIQRRSKEEWKAHQAGKLELSVVRRGERLDLTIDSGAAVCGLPEGCAQEVALEALNGPGKEYMTANGEKIKELGSKTPALEFQNGDTQKLKFQVMNVHKPLVAVSKIVAAGNKVVFAPEAKGGSYIECLNTKKKMKVFERNGVYVLPSWVSQGKANGMLAPVESTCPNDGQA